MTGRKIVLRFKKEWAALICSVFLMAACRPGIPKDIIQPEKMRLVLYDMHVTDGYLSTIPVPDSARTVGAAYYKAVYKKHGIDSATYNKSMNYYYDHVSTLTELYKDITARITKSKDSMDKIQAKILKKQERVKKVQDSLDKVHPERVTKRADSLKKAIKDSTDKVKLQAEAKLLAEKKARRDSAERAKSIRKEAKSNIKAK